jgi:hypothetical protein
MSGHHKWADIRRKSKKSNDTVKVGTIWFHPMAGSSRPFIVNKIKDGVAYSKNMDDDGDVEHSVEELTTFLTENPEHLL